MGKRRGRKNNKKVQYLALSWSWASVQLEESWVEPDFQVQHIPDKDIIEDWNASLIDYHVETANGNFFGRLNSGRIRIQGKLMEASHLRGKSIAAFNYCKNSSSKQNSSVQIYGSI